MFFHVTDSSLVPSAESPWTGMPLLSAVSASGLLQSAKEWTLRSSLELKCSASEAKAFHHL